nr:carbon starvation protein A [Pseudodesulfovibrio sp.]
MTLFFGSIILLILGYFIYGSFVAKVFGIDPGRPTPAKTMTDGVDYVEMPVWKVFLIQLLNIAGLGPIFGPILGALYGPIALVWIVIGCIFGGAVHDFFSGMLSVRHGGRSIPDVVGLTLGKGFQQFMRGFSVVLLILVGIVFVLGPAGLLQNLTDISTQMWVVIIFIYYFIATILPVDKVIGRIYPIFGAILIFMAVGLAVMMIAKGYSFESSTLFTHTNPQDLPLWPLVFITIACGAISGFHATQSPMMARCLPNEKYGHMVFYGGMIAEGIIAIIWASLAIAFFDTPEELNEVLGTGGPALVVNTVSTELLGAFGGILAVIGVVLLPVTSGDTAFRSARLIIADFMGLSQKENMKRIFIAVPLFLVGFMVSLTEFGLIWRYFGWANQTMAAIVLWAASAHLAMVGKSHWLTTIPALFMTCVVSTFLCYAQIGFNLPMPVATGVGIAVSVISLILFLRYRTGEAAASAAVDYTE